MNKIVVSSSTKFKDLVGLAMRELESIGFVPLFPNLDCSKKDTDLTIQEKKKLMQDHYKAIEESDAIYFILPKGYMGTSCKIELGYALALKKPIYFSEPTNDVGLDWIPNQFIPLNHLTEFKKLLA